MAPLERGVTCPAVGVVPTGEIQGRRRARAGTVAGVMDGPVHGSARALLAPALVALVALLVAPTRGRGGRDHGDWDAAGLLPPLPPREDAARVARFVTHVCDWGALATISTQEAVRGWAFADVLSLSDGPPGAGSGVPYFYLSPMQQLVGNLQVSVGTRAVGPGFLSTVTCTCLGGTDLGNNLCSWAPPGKAIHTGH